MDGATVDAFDLDEFLPYRLCVAANHVGREFAERYRREFGISIAEWRVLAHLSQTGPVSVREINAAVDMDKSKISRAAARLQAAGHITKQENPRDRRLVELSLTATGQDLLTRLIPVAREYQAELTARLGPDAQGVADALVRLAGQDAT
ncbi:DNA-binding MarR family transcriptional regulator [Rhodovulum bhavnagarense]|uniref:DNA-binding MarR family transcriptional regulator n=1 Tax=Rhodovulum bhavnagarense TaxID=992286 RepID=A0A4V2SVI7_9RHOB|nr:MarR family winged helix-turn-helix transcriptional regulator [Rhodovulum bhavnagarense]TCP58696.1 DNA-binding MarR family transcriptional regulator [Rhodovulum bhavnagarense]